MTNVIVGIHGLANKPEQQVLSDWWETSIREGLQNRGVENADFKFVMVHWAKYLYKSLMHADSAFDFDPNYLNQPYVKAAGGALYEYHQGFGDRLREKVTDFSGSIIGLIRKPLRLAALEDRLLESKVRDLNYYYDDSKELVDDRGEKHKAREVLMGALTETLKPLKDDRLLLIAHSMGTIIAYDVLRDLGQDIPDFNVEQFITIGSPLGITAVKQRVYSERRYASVPVRTPTVVKEKWVNYADPKDVVAVDPHLRGDYGPNASGIQVVDNLIHNDYTAPNGQRRPHKSFGYLRAPELSDQVKDFLQR